LRYTNKHSIPAEIVRAIHNDSYSRGDAEISVTGLLQPPRINLLRKKHDEKIIVDYKDEVWKLVGQSIHGILERANENVDGIETEKRMFVELGGLTVSGQTDSFVVAENCLKDYKVTSVWKIIFLEEDNDWVSQLNMYRYMQYKTTGDLVRKLQVVAILRDWNANEAMRRGGDYPQCAIHVVNIPTWTIEQTEKFMLERIELHLSAQAKYTIHDELPLCSDKDKWKQDDKYAVMKGKNKRALKVFTSKDDAEMYCKNLDDVNIVERKGKSSRCEGNYCNVAEFCDQFNMEKINMEKINE